MSMLGLTVRCVPCDEMLPISMYQWISIFRNSYLKIKDPEKIEIGNWSTFREGFKGDIEISTAFPIPS